MGETYIVYCADSVQLAQSREMFANMLYPVLTRNTARRLETVTGVTIIFATTELELCGLRAKGYICIDNSFLDSEVKHSLKISTLL